MKALAESDEAPEIPMTSLIDVVFLLLIFFLVATNFVRREIDHDVKLPAAGGGEARAAPTQNLVINIRADGTVVVDGALLEFAALRPRVAAWRDANPNRRVSIRGDGRVTYQSVMRVFGLCRDAGVTDVELPVVPEPPGDAA